MAFGRFGAFKALLKPSEYLHGKPSGETVLLVRCGVRVTYDPNLILLWYNPSNVHHKQQGHRVEARKLEHGFRRISARIPYTLP